MQINPVDNLDNLPPDYIGTLKGLSTRLQKRFLLGEFADDNPNSLFPEEFIDKWRHVTGPLPDFQRIVIGVDPSGSMTLSGYWLAHWEPTAMPIFLKTAR
jgi:phage terminase large subunit-like protein